MVRLDRAATKLLALVSTVGVIGAITVTSAGSAVAASASTGPRQQAVVSLAGNWAVTVPGLHVQQVLASLHVEIVDGTSAQLAELAATPDVLGVEPNAAAHLDSDSFGDGSNGGSSNGGWSNDGWSNGGHWGSGGHWGTSPSPSQPADPTQAPSSGAPAPAPSPTTTPTADPTTGPTDPTTDPTPSASPSPSDSPSPDGVIAPSTLGGAAGTPTAGQGVTIALIDTGVTDTAALNRASGRLVDAVDTSGLNTPSGHVREHGTFTDGYGHGTFMASLIAGGPVDGSGATGIGVAPGATIDVVKVADDAGNTSLASVLAGLNWVATHSDQVDVANLSLSVDQPSPVYGIDPLNLAVTLLRASGVTVVVAAGNTPGLVGDPGFDPAALTVGAADTTGTTPTVASFSGYGNVDGVGKPDVVAAGVNILGEMPANSLISQQFPNARQPDGLFRGSGTSQSTALVSGLAALYLQSNSSASPQQVKSAIRGTASSAVTGTGAGLGLVTIPVGQFGSGGTGESSLNLAQWFSTAPQWGALLGGGSFDSRRWSARRWSADGWNSRLWAGVGFDSRLWADGTFDSRLWAGVGFDSRLWAGGTFDSRLWSARMWGSRMWASRMWADDYWGSTP